MSHMTVRMTLSRKVFFSVCTYMDGNAVTRRMCFSGKRGHLHPDPGREALPSGGVAERMADLLHRGHENCRPDRYALHVARGPPVVTDQQQEQRRVADEVHNRKRVGIKDRPAVETRVQKRHRSEPHQPLVHCRLETVAITDGFRLGEGSLPRSSALCSMHGALKPSQEIHWLFVASAGDYRADSYHLENGVNRTTCSWYPNDCSMVSAANSQWFCPEPLLGEDALLLVASARTLCQLYTG